MQRSHSSRVAAIFFAVLAVLIAIPVVLTWQPVRQEHLNQALIAAVRKNDTQAVISSLNQGADANAEDTPPRPFWQILREQLQGVQTYTFAPPVLLVALMPSVDSSGRQVMPPGNPALVRALLDHGANANLSAELTKVTNGTPLYFALGKNTMVHLLLSHGANVNPNADHSRAPLVEAAGCSSDIIEDMLKHGADINQSDQYGETALMAAMGALNVETVRCLLAHHADVTIRDHDGETALKRAKESQYEPLIFLLKQARAKR